MTDIEVDAADVLAEVKRAFALYEAALVANDVEALDSLFWSDGRTVRYGASENLYGIEAIRAFRTARSPLGLARQLGQTVITSFDQKTATAMTLFVRDGQAGAIGRQSQTWIRFSDGWKIVAAHVSLIGET